MDAGLGIPTAVFLKTFGWPVVSAGGVVLLAALVGRRAAHLDLVPRSIGLAVAAGVVTALVGLRGVPAWPPTDTLDWAGPLVALAAVVGVGADALPGRWRRVASLASAPALAVVASRLLLVPPAADPSWSWTWVPFALCALWVVTVASRSAPATGWFGAWAGAAAGAAGLLALAGSALLGQVLASVAAVGGGLAILALPVLRGATGRVLPGVVAPLVLAYGGVLAYAWAFTEAPRGPLSLAFLAPASSALGLAMRRRPLLALVASALAALALLGGAAAWTAAVLPEPYSPS